MNNRDTWFPVIALTQVFVLIAVFIFWVFKPTQILLIIMRSLWASSLLSAFMFVYINYLLKPKPIYEQHTEEQKDSSNEDFVPMWLLGASMTSSSRSFDSGSDC